MGRLNSSKRFSNLTMENFTTQISNNISLTERKPNDLLFLASSHCQFSLFLFSKSNLLRQYCHKFAFHSMFETGILMIIMICSVKMIIDTYEDDNNVLLLVIDDITTVIFVIEFLMKIIAKGFILHKDTYLRESWNQLDFRLVISSGISIVFEQINIPFIKVFNI